MNGINLDRIPKTLRDRKQWVLWKSVIRGEDKPTKVPLRIDGSPASSTDPSQWSTFGEVKPNALKYSGIGFVFSPDDPLCGIDLDGCRDPATGKVADWAREIILAFDTYGEVSPSETGVKLWLIGRNQDGSGKKKAIAGESSCGKSAAIEVYDRGRYFAVTGWKLKGPDEPQPRQQQLDEFLSKHWQAEPRQQNFYSPTAVIERARKYVAKMPPSVSGQKGHDAAFHVACVLVMGFGLPFGEAMAVMSEWNQTCQPPWSEKELTHKIKSAGKQPGERNYLRNTMPDQWDSVPVPSYKAPTPIHEPKMTTLADATVRYVETLKAGKVELIELGLADVDYAIGGGVDRGELVVLAARPSHGKSAIALQCVHTWTASQRPCLIISEEMSALALGKRTLQFISDVPEEHWRTSIKSVEADVEAYAKARAPAVIAESCGSTASALEQIDKAVAEQKIQAAIVDYAQILHGTGKDRYEKITNTSIALKQAAAKYNIVILLLCQLSREIEKRQKFTPFMSDIKETGQLEQDADVILFSVWPHRIDSAKPAEEFMFFVAKNRNRPINQGCVTCRFVPSRQMILPPRVKDKKNYHHAFDEYNDQGSF